MIDKNEKEKSGSGVYNYPNKFGFLSF